MKMTLSKALEMIQRGLTQEQYEKRCIRLRRLCNERDYLEDAIEILKDDPRYAEKAENKMIRLRKVNRLIEELK